MIHGTNGRWTRPTSVRRAEPEPRADPRGRFGAIDPAGADVLRRPRSPPAIDSPMIGVNQKNSSRVPTP